MSFLNSFFISIFCSKIGEDQFGNKYYESKATDYLNNRKRYVLYKGKAEPSKVPPLWHAWLHYMGEIPKAETNYSWQREYLPNLTGTKLSYNPAYDEGGKKKSFAYYSKWQPK